jgi:hypothetical protein
VGAGTCILLLYFLSADCDGEHTTALPIESLISEEQILTISVKQIYLKIGG